MRSVRVEDRQEAPRPTIPEEPDYPDAPIPEFTLRVHTDYRWCGWNKGYYDEARRGHIYSVISSKIQRVQAWKLNHLYGDGSLTIDWVENGWMVCPHCQAEEHAKKCDEVRGDFTAKKTKAEMDAKDWDRRQWFLANGTSRRRRRRVKLV